MKIPSERRIILTIFILAGAFPAPVRAQQAPAASPIDAAYAALKEGRTDDAAALLKSVPRADPAARLARHELAYLHLRKKEWKEAIALLGELLDGAAPDARLRMELGYARQALGDRAAAADEFTLAAKEPGEFQQQARAALAGLAAGPSGEQGGDVLSNEGYEHLRKDDPAAAREKFSMALRSDPGRTLIAKQLGYMSLAEGDGAAAAARLEGVRRLAPRDYQTALELGYIYDSLHDEAAAERSFAAALPSPDPGVQAAARRALAGYRGRTDPLYLDVEAAAWSASRFPNKIVSLDARAGWKPDPYGPLSFYFALRGTQDSRSRGGTAPEIYSDDAVSFAPGIRLQPKGWNASLSADWGLTVNLLRSDQHPDRTQTDGRAVLTDYRYWRGPGGLFADAGLTLGWYGRFRDNVIGTLRLRGGLRVHPGRYTALTAYVPVNAHKDANRDFFNNLVETGVGLELQPSTLFNLNLRAEALRGAYTGIEGRDRNPYPKRYDEFRLMLVYSAHFSRRPERDEFVPTRRRRFVW